LSAPGKFFLKKKSERNRMKETIVDKELFFHDCFGDIACIYWEWTVVELKIVDNQMGVDKRRRGKKEEKKKDRTHKIGEEVGRLGDGVLWRQWSDKE
jgi:hypothetical protein